MNIILNTKKPLQFLLFIQARNWKWLISKSAWVLYQSRSSIWWSNCTFQFRAFGSNCDISKAFISHEYEKNPITFIFLIKKNCFFDRYNTNHTVILQDWTLKKWGQSWIQKTFKSFSLQINFLWLELGKYYLVSKYVWVSYKDNYVSHI